MHDLRSLFQRIESTVFISKFFDRPSDLTMRTSENYNFLDRYSVAHYSGYHLIDVRAVKRLSHHVENIR